MIWLGAAERKQVVPLIPISYITLLILASFHVIYAAISHIRRLGAPS